MLQRRVEVPEEWLKRMLHQLNTQIQFQMMLPEHLARDHESRRMTETQQLQQMHPQVRNSTPIAIITTNFNPIAAPFRVTPRCRNMTAHFSRDRAAPWSGERRGGRWATGTDA